MSEGMELIRRGARLLTEEEMDAIYGDGCDIDVPDTIYTLGEGIRKQREEIGRLRTENLALVKLVQAYEKRPSAAPPPATANHYRGLPPHLGPM